MTREEAVKRLKYVYTHLNMKYANEQERKSLIAIDMAIKSLEQEPKIGRCIKYDNVVLLLWTESEDN